MLKRGNPQFGILPYQVDGQDGLPFLGWKFVDGATCWMPALFTTISSRVNDCRTLLIILADGVRLRHIGGGIFHPDIDFDTICACAAAMSSGSLPVENDRGAGAASARAMPRPIPLVEPVTRGHLPGERAPARNVALRHRNIHGQLRGSCPSQDFAESRR